MILSPASRALLIEGTWSPGYARCARSPGAIICRRFATSDAAIAAGLFLDLFFSAESATKQTIW